MTFFLCPRTVIRFVALSVIFVAAAFDAGAQSPVQRVFDPADEDWFAIQTGTLFLSREVNTGATLFRESGTDAALVTSDATDTDWETGLLAEAAVLLTDQYAVTGRFFEVDDFATQGLRVDAPTGVHPPGSPTSTIGGVTDLGHRFESEVLSADLMMHRRLNDDVSIGAGTRYVSVDEFLLLRTEQPLFDPTTLSHVDNDLWGGQIGLEFSLLRGDRFDLGLTSNAGIYNNHRVFAIADVATTLSDRIEEDALAFVGELIFRGSYRLTDHWSLVANYQLMWVDGVSLAADQVTGGNYASNVATTGIPTSRFDDSSVFYHGGFASVRFEF